MHSFFANRANDVATLKGGNELGGKKLHTHMATRTEQNASNRDPELLSEVDQQDFREVLSLLLAPV